MSDEAKERPILFSAPMVRAILAGSKTQTRRVVKTHELMLDRLDSLLVNPKRPGVWDYYDSDDQEEHEFCCPYGVPGERLWVRETFWARKGIFPNAVPGYHDLVFYRADPDPAPNLDRPLTWKPSIFMPRWASRLTLEITEVRLERLMSITHADAIAEGITGEQSPRAGYAALWDTINAKRGFDWASNPWVWALTFKMLESERRR